MNFPATLQCFADEYTRIMDQPPPALEKWYEMTQVMDLSSLSVNTSASLLESTNSALLERIVAQAFARFRRRPESAISKPPTTVVVSKRPATAAPSLKFASKRSLPMGSSTAVAQSKSTSALPSPVVRPKSALGGATSRSTTHLIPQKEEVKGYLAVSSDHRSSNNDENQCQTPTSKVDKGLSPPKSPTRRLSGGAESPKMQSNSPLDPKKSAKSSLPTGVHRMMSVKPTESSKRHSTQPSKSVRLLGIDNSGSRKQPTKVGAESTGGGARPEVDDLDSTVDLEDMTEEHLAEHFSAFSKSNIRKVRRVLAKSSAHSQELQRTRTALDRIQLKAQQKHEQSAFAAKQTDLLSTTMDMLIKEPCSLCRVVFLKKNLTTRVSYKGICDLRASWAAKKRQEQLETTALAATSGSHLMPPERAEYNAVDVEEPTMALESTQQISHLYDEVPVCVFCAQLALDFSSYRPSSAEQKQRKEADRRVATERQKQRDVQRQRDRIKCDPLDFHSYELNSDDDDDEVEIEEVLEVDANGRVNVVRRPRNRRRTVRTPAQTGLVSRRIHYENLRSQSVHALNRKEWEVIAQSQLG